MRCLALRWLFIVCSLFASVSICQQNCYYPNGVQDPRMLPCDTSQDNSACCYENSYCLTNGLCFGQGDTYSNRISRVGCTDRSWKDPACPQYCQDVGNSGGISLLIGRETYDGDFCCGAGYNFSSKQCYYSTEGSYEPIKLAPGYIILDRTGAATTNYAGLGLPGSVPSTFDSSGASATPSNSAASASISQSSAETPAPIATGTPQTGQVASCSSENDNGDGSVALGAGLGAGLGVAFLAMTGLFIWQSLKSRKLNKTLKQCQPMQSSPMNVSSFGSSFFGAGQYRDPQHDGYGAHPPNSTKPNPEGLAELAGHERQELEGHNRL